MGHAPVRPPARALRTVDGRRVAPSHASAAALATVRHDFILASQVVFYVLAGIMAVSFVVAAPGMARGIPEHVLRGANPDLAA